MRVSLVRNYGKRICAYERLESVHMWEADNVPRLSVCKPLFYVYSFRRWVHWDRICCTYSSFRRMQLAVCLTCFTYFLNLIQYKRGLVMYLLWLFNYVVAIFAEIVIRRRSVHFRTQLLIKPRAQFLLSILSERCLSSCLSSLRVYPSDLNHKDSIS